MKESSGEKKIRLMIRTTTTKGWEAILTGCDTSSKDQDMSTMINFSDTLYWTANWIR